MNCKMRERGRQGRGTLKVCLTRGFLRNYNREKEAVSLTQLEIVRSIHALRRKGWTDTEIIEYILEVAGDSTEIQEEQAKA